MAFYHNHYSDIITADPLLTGAQRNVFKLLTGLMRTNRSQFVAISKPLIAIKAGCKETAADTAIKRLRELEYIRLERSEGGRDGKSYNVYRVFDIPTPWYEAQMQLLKPKKKMPEYKKLAMAIATVKKAGHDVILNKKTTKTKSIKEYRAAKKNIENM